jgi:hypothetical protein
MTDSKGWKLDLAFNGYHITHSSGVCVFYVPGDSVIYNEYWIILEEFLYRLEPAKFDYH